MAAYMYATISLKHTPVQVQRNLTMGAAPSRQEASSASSNTGEGRAVPTMAPSAATTSDTTNQNQAQSKRAPAPHMFREIVADEKVTDAAALEDQVSTGILLAGKTKVRVPLNMNCHEMI
jgi:hypothetical protein